VRGSTKNSAVVHGIHVIVVGDGGGAGGGTATITTRVQGIYNYIPKSDHVSRVHNVATVLSLHVVVLVMLISHDKRFVL
jgi:hypothetical protein